MGFALDGEGLPHFTYYDLEGEALMYAAGIRTGSWIHETIDDQGALQSTLGIQPDGTPVVAYLPLLQVPDPNSSNFFVQGVLRVARRTSLGWSTVTLDGSSHLGSRLGGAFDAAGLLHLLAVDESDPKRFRVIYYVTDGERLLDEEMVDDQIGGGPTQPAAIDPTSGLPTGPSGPFLVSTALAIAPDGTVHAAYFSPADASIRYAVRGRDQVWRKSLLDATQVSGDLSLALFLDPSGRPRVCYDRNYADSLQMWYAEGTPTGSVSYDWSYFLMAGGGGERITSCSLAAGPGGSSVATFQVDIPTGGTIPLPPCDPTDPAETNCQAAPVPTGMLLLRVAWGEGTRWTTVDFQTMGRTGGGAALARSPSGIYGVAYRRLVEDFSTGRLFDRLQFAYLYPFPPLP